MIQTAHVNILESSSVTLVSGSASPDTPIARLWDRNIGRLFIASAAGTLLLKIDQGASPIAADRLIIPDGHNLSGAALSLAHSDDDAEYSDALPAWQAAPGLITVSWAPVTKRWWKFTIASPAAAPALPELFLTRTYQWQRNPCRPTGGLSAEFNVKTARSSGGQERYMVMGPPRRRRFYGQVRFGASMRSEMEALESTWKGACPFWLCDHESRWLFGGLDASLGMAEIAEGLWRMRFDFLEAAP